MKIIVAPDSFKGSVSAVEASAAIVRGIHRVIPGAEVIEIPMADGGEGTVAALVAATGGQFRRVRVCGPLRTPVEAEYGILPCGTAVIEMAAAAGLPLVPLDQRDPLKTTTYGVGELLLDALRQGCREMIIGIGGSATNDCGCGMAQALGVKFYDRQRREITAPLSGGDLGVVESLDIRGMAGEFRSCRFVVACDVENPLLGPAGATMVYSGQKGADDAAKLQLETNLGHMIGLIETATGRQVRQIPGAGAAGGMGAGLMAFLGGQLDRGIEIVLRATRFAEKLQGAHLIITGEGRIDASTVYGKTIAGIARLASPQGVPVVALAGSIGEEAHQMIPLGVEAYASICPGPIDLTEAMQRGGELLTHAAEQAIRWVLVGARGNERL